MMKYSKELEELREKCDEYSKHYEKYGIDELPKHYEFLKNNVRFYSMFPRTDEVDKEKAQQALENLKKEHNKIFSLENNFEWRIEFSKLLDTGLTQEQIANNNKNKQKRNFKNLHKNNQGDFLGFDLVIGNPPYIRQEEIKHLKPQLQKAFRIYKGTSDIYTYFYEQGHKILKHNGILSFITSNKYCRAGYGEPLREFLLEATALLYYIELNGIKVFDSASVDTSILSFIKTTPDSKHTFDYAHPKDYDTKANVPLQEYITPQSLLQSSLTKESFIFQDSTNAALKAKIEKIGTPLKEWDISIYRGILTGYNEAFIIDSAKRDEILRNCVSENERQRTSELIKPILRGRDIKRYSYEWAGLWIIGTFPALKLNIDDYPALRNYLESYRPRIDQSGEKGCRKKTSNKWFETQDNIAYYQEFEKEKIVYSEIVREPQFYLDSGEFKFGNFYAEATSFILSGNENFTHSLHYLLGILHSKLITYAFKEFYAGGGLGESGYRYKKVFLERLPIPKVDSKTEAKFIQIVQEIVESKKQGRDTKELESTLDAMVCKLYNLSDDEIRFVESMGGGGVIIALLLIAVIESRLSKLTKLLIENFEKELCEAFRFCEGLKLPQREYQGKILYPCIMAKEPCFVYEEKGFFAPAPANLITGQEQDIKYLTGLLNSTFIYFAMRNFYMGGGIDGELKTNNLLKLPIPQITESNKPLCDEIIKCVEKILEIKACHTEALAEVSKNTESKKDISPFSKAQNDKADSALDTKELESKLDSLVYTLYNLTNDEIAIIDSKT